MVDGVTVDLAALTTFASTLATTSDTHSSQAVGDAGNLVGLTGMMRGSTGAPEGDQLVCYVPTGFVEAEDFAARHDVMAQSVLQFMSDSVTGLANLALGAETCAIRYAATDRSNAAAFAKMGGGDPGDHTFAGFAVQLSGRATVSSSDVLDAFSPTGDEVMLSAPVLNTGATTTSATPTWAAGRPKPAPAPAASTGNGAAPAPMTPVSRAGTQSDEDFNAEVQAKLQQLKEDGVIQPDAPTSDPGQGFTIGHDPTLAVQPDQAPMPIDAELPHAVTSN